MLTAQYITGAKLPAIQDLYTRRCQRKALKLSMTPATPVMDCSLYYPKVKSIPFIKVANDFKSVYIGSTLSGFFSLCTDLAFWMIAG